MDDRAPLAGGQAVSIVKVAVTKDFEFALALGSLLALEGCSAEPYARAMLDDCCMMYIV